MVKHGENIRVFKNSYDRNDTDEMIDFLWSLKINKKIMVGYNNINFDYPVLHYILLNPPATVADIYNKAMSIINAPYYDRFSHIIWDRDRFVKQLDLFRIHHFDNMAKATSLKIIEFNMRSENIQDLPFPPGTFLTNDQIDTLIKYNIHDVTETEKFFYKSEDQINLRTALSEKYNKDVSNFNDKKLGVDYLITRLEEIRPGSCYNSHHRPNQTERENIAFKDIIFPYIQFAHPEFKRVHDYLTKLVITDTKNSITDLTCTINDFTYVFGTGGIHGSVTPSRIEEDAYYMIKDIDVTSYYPSIGIVNRVYPEHLGDTFCDIYADIKKQRLSYPKGSPEYKMLKLSLNGSYGDSNNEYSPLYDPQYTMTITINGQLMLCMLAEQLMNVPDLKMIQINTDGITVKYPRHLDGYVTNACKWWESVTKLELESVTYHQMFIRDVNNYIAVGNKIKRKGVYEYELEWHQNHSALVVRKAAEASLLHNIPVEDFILTHNDIMDFMLRTKVPRTSSLMLDNRQLQNICRYYISNTGGSLYKMMPPLAGKTSKRKIGINVGWLVTECNNMKNYREDINYQYYIDRCYRIIDKIVK